MPRVSIILTTYERPDMLRRAVESVLAQTYQDFELIVVDDNSQSPRQIEALQEIMFKSDRIRLVRTDVQSQDRLKTTRYATCINLALKNFVNGEFITYLCDDDYYMPTRLERMVGFLDANPDKSVVYGSQATYYKDPSTGNEVLGAVRTASTPLDRADCVVDHSSVMHRRSCFNFIEGFWDDAPEHWGHGDGVFWTKLNNAGFKFFPINEILDAHVYHDGSWTKKVGELANQK